MIPEGEARTRAVLWLLADLDPDMPVIQALGYLKAVEARLAVMEAEASGASVDPRYRGAEGPANMALDFAGHRKVNELAKAGKRAAVAVELSKLTGAGAAVVMPAAATLVNMLREEPGGMMSPF